MKDNNFNKLKNILNSITLKTDNTGHYILGFSNNPHPMNSSNSNNMGTKSESSKETNAGTKIEDSKNKGNSNNDYIENEADDYKENLGNDYTEKQDVYSNSYGVIDSITNELTSARLQQAIILSEIVGKPRSKTRRKRRF